MSPDGTGMTWAQFKTDYVATGKVLIAFGHLPLQGHVFARNAAVSADCAGHQGKFWEMHDLLFQKQAELSDTTGRALASSLGLDGKAFDECARRQTVARISQDQNFARTLGISVTPTFVIGIVRPNRTVKVAQVLSGAQPVARFRAVLDELLDRRAN